MKTLYSFDASRKIQSLNRVGIRTIHARINASGQAESLLEQLIAEQPELLGITFKDDESDIEGPFVAFCQCGVQALNGRTIYPDVLLLSRSGHVVVVEVKLGDNPELKDRKVVGQVLEYAVCLSSCSEADLLRLFSREGSRAETWTERVAELFDTEDAERLAGRFLAKFRNQDLHLVIACDDVPMGLRELVSGVVTQRATGDYTFRVVEIAPFVRGDDFDNFILVPEVKIRTEIVARTLVTVTSKEGEQEPGVYVTVTSLEEAEAQHRKAVERAGSRAWDEKSFFEHAKLQLGEQEALAAVWGVYETAKARGYSFRWGRGKESGSFSVLIPRLSDKPVYAMYSNGGWCINFVHLNDADEKALREKLRKIPGINISESPKYSFIHGWIEQWREILQAIEALAGA